MSQAVLLQTLQELQELQPTRNRRVNKLLPTMTRRQLKLQQRSLSLVQMLIRRWT